MATETRLLPIYWDASAILSVLFEDGHSLHAANLWHLAMAKGLQEQLPELVLLTFDDKLEVAAQGEGLGSQQS